jgi:hypothetical protein
VLILLYFFLDFCCHRRNLTAKLIIGTLGAFAQTAVANLPLGTKDPIIEANYVVEVVYASNRNKKGKNASPNI